jgi:CRISPR-associated protein (TIGR03986 family)
MQDETGTVRYVVPGSSLKGLVRSEVEALTNSLFGAIDRRAHERRHLYRRRALNSVGVIEDTSTTTWKVREAKLLYVDANDWRPNGFSFPTKYDVVASHRDGRPISRMKAVPLGYTLDRRKYEAYVLCPPQGTTDPVEYLGSLFARPDDKTYSHLLIFKAGRTLDLDEEVRKTYHQDVLKHPHFEEHAKRSGRDPKTGCDKYPRLPTTGSGEIDWERAEGSIMADLQLKQDDLVFFTAKNQKITTIGKNINYLWPAEHSVYSLAKDYFPPVDSNRNSDNSEVSEVRSLDVPLTLAERMFGFAAKHSRTPKSHPFKGRVSVEAAWGREAETYEKEQQDWPELTPENSIPPDSRGVRLELAPVTGPTARAKSRPLYLQPVNSKSASYDDNPKPALQGRKFYWHQNNDDPERPIWKNHLYDADWHSQVKKQCPPLLCALTPLTQNAFKGRIRFRNLTKIELGALLYALEGSSADHCLKLGKAKARGLGSVRFSVTGVSKIDVEARYTSLEERAGIKEIPPNERADAIKNFLTWHSSKPDSEKVLRAYTKLHAFPSGRSVRYFPINFRDYGWLPGSGKENTTGEPQEPRRPGMKPAWL